MNAKSQSQDLLETEWGRASGHKPQAGSGILGEPTEFHRFASRKPQVLMVKITVMFPHGLGGRIGKEVFVKSTQSVLCNEGQFSAEARRDFAKAFPKPGRAYSPL